MGRSLWKAAFYLTYLRLILHSTEFTHFQWASQWLLSKFAKLYNHHPKSILEYFHHPNEILRAHWLLPPVPTLAAANPPSFSIDALFLGISYPGNHTLCGLLCLASSTQHNVLKTHLYFIMYQYSVPFYGWIVFHCIDRSQFVYPSADGHLDWFPFLALTNNAAVKVEVYENSLQDLTPRCSPQPSRVSSVSSRRGAWALFCPDVLCFVHIHGRPGECSKQTICLLLEPKVVILGSTTRGKKKCFLGWERPGSNTSESLPGCSHLVIPSRREPKLPPIFGADRWAAGFRISSQGGNLGIVSKFWS